MPCPFPGMAPYLESNARWPGFHHAFLTYVRDAIQPALPPNYFTALERRVYFEPASGWGRGAARVPDLKLHRTGPAIRRGGKSAVLEVGPRAEDVDLDPIEYREAYLSIREATQGELVTSYELLGPSNKRPGEGREAYLRKQNELVVAGVNQVEVDLLRGRWHTILPGEEKLARLLPVHCLASIYRVSDPRRCQVLGWTVRDRCPTIPVPLAPGDPEIPLDLQAVFTKTYERGVFDRVIRYDREPNPPLAAEDAGWAASLITRAGLGAVDRA